MKFPFASLKRIGKYRIVNAELRWGIDLFDDLQKLEDLGAFRMAFDVGANVGRISERFLRHFPEATIHAFEPVGSTFTRLQRALGHHPRLTLHNMAASDAAGPATIRLFDDTNGCEISYAKTVSKRDATIEIPRCVAQPWLQSLAPGGRNHLKQFGATSVLLDRQYA